MSAHLVIGASGMVGEHLVRSFLDLGLDACGTYQSHPVAGMKPLDIRDPKEVLSFIESHRPDYVYLTASMANVDYCELHPKEGYATNVLGVKNTVEAINQFGPKLVYFSSDYIFDGLTGPYQESATPNPICEYGRQKLIAEHYISLHAHNFLIIRTTGVYGWERQGKNFIYRLLNTLQNGQILTVPVDQLGTPTYAPVLAKAVIELALLNEKGVYHVSGSEKANRYELALEAAKVFKLDATRIQPIPTIELGQVAPRPLKAGLLVEKAAARLSLPLIGYKEGLQVMAQTMTSR